jgi:hypothetical protein
LDAANAAPDVASLHPGYDNPAPAHHDASHFAISRNGDAIQEHILAASTCSTSS